MDVDIPFYVGVGLTGYGLHGELGAGVGLLLMALIIAGSQVLDSSEESE